MKNHLHNSLRQRISSHSSLYQSSYIKELCISSYSSLYQSSYIKELSISSYSSLYQSSNIKELSINFDNDQMRFEEKVSHSLDATV
jgi:hypothetical protein